jgi:hypothetical protein
MKIDIEIDDSLFAKAKKISGIADKDLLIEKALNLFVTIEIKESLWI